MRAFLKKSGTDREIDCVFAARLAMTDRKYAPTPSLYGAAMPPARRPAFHPEQIPMSLHALLFDLDGTLIDSDARHFEAFRRVSAPYGVDFDEAFFLHHMSGHSSAEICGALFPSLSAAGHRRIADDKEALFRHLLTSGASAIRGAVELVDWAAARKDRDLD